MLQACGERDKRSAEAIEAYLSGRKYQPGISAADVLACLASGLFIFANGWGMVAQWLP
ncbi:MAG: hypothetical protein ACRD7E_13840 [Bryobacteraceae bacterium]